MSRYLIQRIEGIDDRTANQDRNRALEGTNHLERVQWRTIGKEHRDSCDQARVPHDRAVPSTMAPGASRLREGIIRARDRVCRPKISRRAQWPSPGAPPPRNQPAGRLPPWETCGEATSNASGFAVGEGSIAVASSIRYCTSEGRSCRRACAHIAAITTVRHPKRRECEECVKIGAQWVHLRTCQQCGTTQCLRRLTQPAREQTRAGQRPSGDRVGGAR